MDDQAARSLPRAVVSLLAKLAVGVALFGLVGQAPAASAPQPKVCPSAISV